MSRSSQHMEKYGRSSENSQDRHHEGTAARTRPLSFDEIMSKRKKKKKLFDDEKEVIEDITIDTNTVKFSERDNGQSKDSSLDVQEHFPEEDVKARSKNTKDNTSTRDENLAKSKDRKIQDSGTKSKPKMDKDLKIKGQAEDKIHSSRKSDERLSKITDTEALDKHSRHSRHIDRHVGGSRGKSDRENKRKDWNGVDEKNRDRENKRKDWNGVDEKNRDRENKRKDRNGVDEKNRDRENKRKDWNEVDEKNRDRENKRKDRIGLDEKHRDRGDMRKEWNGVDEKNRDKYPARKHDLREGHDSESLDRKERKESSKSHYEELKLKRRRSRSLEGVERNRRSISPLRRSQKRTSYHSREPELSAYSSKGGSERKHPDIDRTKTANNGSSAQHKRHGGFTSGLGGYSPRKRRTEAAAKTPSPTKHSPEKKSAKWDVAPKGSDNTSSVSFPSNFQLPQKTVSLSMHEAVIAVPAPSIAVKPFSGVPYNLLSIKKNDSVDTVQLTQATRPMRRLYVENIPASASEKAVMEFLNNFFISSGVNHVKGTQPCISCNIHKEKGQALVEFLTPEDASAALNFDGSSFSGSIIKIRRPKDFVELATGELDKSVAAVGTMSNTVKDSPHKVFIGGISKALSSEMVMEIASAFGPLKAYRFENSDDLNVSHTFLEYADQSVTFRACVGLNGMKLGGQVITVLQVDPNASTLESSVDPPFYGIPDHAKPLLEKPTQVLKLKNLFDQESFPSLSNTEIEEVVEDVRLECMRFGAVKSVNVVMHGSAPSSTLESCEVNENMELAESQQNLEFDETNTERDTPKGATDHIIAEGNGGEHDKAGHDIVGDEARQPDQFNSDIFVENLPVKSIPESQEHSQQTSKDESGSIDEKIIGNIHVEDSSAEDKQPIGGDSNLEQVAGDTKEALVDEHVIESDAIEKGHHGEQNCDRGNIFELGCVLVEFGRVEASCAAAHCLHGRLFDNRTVTVEYIPLDVYKSWFTK